MRIKNVMDMNKGLFEDVEAYKLRERFVSMDYVHTDKIEYTEEDLPLVSDDAWALMGEDEYNHTVLANAQSLDFEKTYGNKDAKVLVCIVGEIYEEGMDLRLLDLTDKARAILADSDKYGREIFVGMSAAEINDFVEEEF